MDLVWHDGRLLIAGPDTVAHLSEDRPGSSYAGLRFAPGVGPSVLGAPAAELRDRRVPLDALWPGALARELAERAGDDPAAVLETWAVARMRAAGPADALPAAVARALSAGGTIAAAAAGTGLGERQVRRRCEAAFGYGPKTLARVLRLQRALALARAGRPYAEVAVEAGFADQPHLAREVRALAGVPLGELLRPPPADAHPAGGDPAAGGGVDARPGFPGRQDAANRSTALPSGSRTTA
ncbi:helix-turn-helix domain-containing protein [Streptomyces sp. PLK6-54]|uniref:Helix-turn-helix domain-containing protein n=2 Tax=Actinacidiphila acidipaludis TaxID=2873382 RepID=A0ABS7Q5N7_9ACTN|nr:helix-turn-helix domain-containing protein [Streptomyces acidipaludis]